MCDGAFDSTAGSSGIRNTVGVDASAEMLEACVVRHAKLVLSETFPGDEAPFKLVLANWTLHFVTPEKRFAYLKAIRKGLNSDGKLVLTEKTAQSVITEALYHDWKRANGLSEAEIEQKKQSLIGVLTPLPAKWYADALGDLGFKVEILWAEVGFVTFLASL